MYTIALTSKIVGVACSVAVLLACSSSKRIMRQSISHSEQLTIQNVNYQHCGCAHIYAEKMNGGRKEFLIVYTNKGTTKSIYRYNTSGAISDTVILSGVSSNDFTIPLDSLDIAIFRKIDSFTQTQPAAPIYKLARPSVKGYVRK